MLAAQTLQEFFTNSSEKNITGAQDWTEVRVSTQILYTVKSNLLQVLLHFYILLNLTEVLSTNRT